MTVMPFGIFGLIFPILFFLLVIRIIRSVFRSSSNRGLESRLRNLGLPESDDEYTTISRYPSPPLRPSTSEGDIFRLADKMKGRLTLSDVVIATNLSIREAETVIESMVDGTHVTMEVSDKGRVVYEFPEIIARYEDTES